MNKERQCLPSLAAYIKERSPVLKGRPDWLLLILELLKRAQASRGKCLIKSSTGSFGLPILCCMAHGNPGHDTHISK
eukprot:1161311-Pelagomonas_calceolata.AAC.18